MTPTPTVSDTTVFLVNLGTPDAPTAPAVARFLREFLLDPRVVAIPRLLWQPLLQWVILPRRSPVVAENFLGRRRRGIGDILAYPVEQRDQQDADEGEPDDVGDGAN